MEYRIPFNKPFIIANELRYVAEAVTRGNLGSDGYFTIQCSRRLEDRLGAARVLMTPSCTASLELACMLCKLDEGDEVILPSFTFVSTVNAIMRLRAKPVFVDIRPDTLNLDEELIEANITPRTKAVIPVHYAGIACEMDKILALAGKHGLVVIEDAAHAVNSYYRGKALGTLGDLGAFSFHETKNIQCGEGGALCVNNLKYLERAQILRDKGTNRQRFLNGLVDKYTWVDVGSSFALSELSCAFLYGQLEMLDIISTRRKAIYDFYRYLLKDLEEEQLLQLPVIPPECSGNGHIFYILLPNLEIRSKLIAHLREKGIQAVFHYVPLHASPMGNQLGYRNGDLPITEEYSQRLLRLPIYHTITREEQIQVASEIDCCLRSLRIQGAFNESIHAFLGKVFKSKERLANAKMATL